MNPKHAVQAAVGWCRACLSIADPPDPLSECEVHDADRALRFTIRSGVAGAAPRNDAWQSLQERIAQEAVPPIAVPGYGRPALIMSPFSLYGSFTRTLLSRFSQLGVALLLLLSVVSDPGALDRLTRPGGRLAHVNPVVQSAPPLSPPVRINRAALLDATDEELAAPAPATVEESDPQPVSNYVPSPSMTLITHPRQAVDPDDVRSAMQGPKMDPR